MYRLQLDVRFAVARAKSVAAQRGHQSFGVEDGVVAEHVIDGASEFDVHHGIGLEFVPVHPGFQPLGQRADDRVIAFGNHGRFPEGPAEIGVAELGSAQILLLAAAAGQPLDQPALEEQRDQIDRQDRRQRGDGHLPKLRRGGTSRPDQRRLGQRRRDCCGRGNKQGR